MIEGLRAPVVFVVLVNWNGGELTIPCIESLAESDYPNFQVVVVDNGSADNSPARITERFPEV